MHSRKQQQAAILEEWAGRAPGDPVAEFLKGATEESKRAIVSIYNYYTGVPGRTAVKKMLETGVCSAFRRAEVSELLARHGLDASPLAVAVEAAAEQCELSAASEQESEARGLCYCEALLRFTRSLDCGHVALGAFELICQDTQSDIDAFLRFCSKLVPAIDGVLATFESKDRATYCLAMLLCAQHGVAPTLRRLQSIGVQFDPAKLQTQLAAVYLCEQNGKFVEQTGEYSRDDSFFATRAALACLVWRDHHGHPCVSWLISVLWCSRDISDVFRSRCYTTASAGCISKNLMRLYGGTDKDQGEKFSTEITSAFEWSKQPDIAGKAANTARALVPIKAADHAFVLEIFKQLLDSTYRSSALIGLAAKLGVFYHGLSEPPCTSPSGNQNAATEQVELVRKLALAVNPDCAPDAAAAPILAMTRAIYYKNVGATEVLAPGFDWQDMPGDWRDKTSFAQRESAAAAGPFLWLYGRLFQKHVDEVINNVAAGLAAHRSACPTGQALSRFLFLVPQVRMPTGAGPRRNRTLADYPGDGAMRNTLITLAMTPMLSGLAIKQDLASPILHRAGPLKGSQPLFGHSHHSGAGT
ncbi:hypothetical protein [Massilia glaciei]|uniref:Uncharacterized protein n=1 Tax=Massilia glaciei TaxID=1524097 RepID=A0A2U2HLK4_9BURK|nr:hypothetical protein [Massilia glaciei]PWF48349.1 hypothetical protein C7C56_012385 [Massilia glaciei]